MARRHLSKIETEAYLAKMRLAFVFLAVGLVSNTDILLIALGRKRPDIYLAAGIVTIFVPFTLCALYAAAKWMMLRGPLADRPCRQCGYELTGLISPRCPECGHVIAEDE